jgi:catechol 2,3-dioxygenase-like lactoylglutathione lyase family enzyme
LADTPAVSAIRHVGLVVADLEGALAFWCGILGFRVERRMDEAGAYLDNMMGLKDVRVTTAKLAAPDGSLIELLKFHSHPDRPGWTGTPYSTGLTHIALTVSDLDALCHRLETAGVTLKAPTQYSPDGRAKATFCVGPEGVLLELVEVLNA